MPKKKKSVVGYLPVDWDLETMIWHEYIAICPTTFSKIANRRFYAPVRKEGCDKCQRKVRITIEEI